MVEVGHGRHEWDRDGGCECDVMKEDAVRQLSGCQIDRVQRAGRDGAGVDGVEAINAIGSVAGIHQVGAHMGSL